MIADGILERWLPPGAQAAVCLSVDDVHPASFDNNGGFERTVAALDHLRRLQARHPRLKVTLFTTADWRSVAPFPTRPGRRRIPVIGKWMYAVPVLRRGTKRLDRYPELCAYLRSWEGAEIALHGLHHIRRGPAPIAEFEGLSEFRCRRMLTTALRIFDEAHLPIARGLSPPAWVAPDTLLSAMVDLQMRFVASSRDLDTPVASDARTNGSGLRGVSLIYPDAVAGGQLVHLPTNYQATSSPSRAFEILDAGGLLSVKAHLLDRLGDYTALDGLTSGYCQQLDALFSTIESRYGQRIWWTTMGEIAERLHTS